MGPAMYREEYSHMVARYTFSWNPVNTKSFKFNMEFWFT